MQSGHCNGIVFVFRHGLSLSIIFICIIIYIVYNICIRYRYFAHTPLFLETSKKSVQPVSASDNEYFPVRKIEFFFRYCCSETILLGRIMYEL